MADGATLIGEYTVRDVDRETFEAMHRKLWPVVFPGIAMPEEKLVADDVAEQREQLRQRMGDDRFRLFLQVQLGDEIVGWSTGVQRSHEEFHMSNSGVLPGHRRNGIYAALLEHVLQRAGAAGFQTVTSHHHPTNSAVLIAKLKAGFVISGMEISDRFGLLVNLTYFFDADRREAFRRTAGAADGV